jgi:hypothetical protein
MKKIIDIKVFTPPIGQEFIVTSYPGPGIYHHPSTMAWTLIYPIGSTLCCLNIGVGYTCPIPVTDVPEPEPTTAILNQTNEASGITASDLLKAIAISQNPLLAKELLK